jgi:hypothetical protein
MADDNSCLFHGIAFLLSEGRNERMAFPVELRASIVKAVEADPVRWNEGTLGKSVADYCTFIKDSRRWGGEVELAIFADMYKSEISVTNVETGRADVFGQVMVYLYGVCRGLVCGVYGAWSTPLRSSTSNHPSTTPPPLLLFCSFAPAYPCSLASSILLLLLFSCFFLAPTL